MTSLEDAFLRQVHQRLLLEERDDALILFHAQVDGGSFIAQMAVLGVDGTLAEFCGNGARAAAAYLISSHPHMERFYLRTERGFHRLLYHGEELYSIKLPSASFEVNPKFVTDLNRLKRECGLVYVEVLEPHLLVKHNLSDAGLFSLGREINQRRDLFPLGINVNAWEILSKGFLYVKTYERGVQRLTQSCGTGSLACAAAYSIAVYQKKNVCVATPGGVLEITLDQDGMELKGPARI
jgi:diaminopimelate epimerase